VFDQFATSVGLTGIMYFRPPVKRACHWDTGKLVDARAGHSIHIAVLQCTAKKTKWINIDGQVLCCSSNQVLIFILSWYTMHRLSYKRYPLSYPYPPYERLAQCQFVVHGLIKKLFSAPIHMKRIDHLFICTQTFFRCLFCFVLFRFLTYVENRGLSRTAVCTFYVCLFAFMIRGGLPCETRRGCSLFHP